MKFTECSCAPSSSSSPYMGNNHSPVCPPTCPNTCIKPETVNCELLTIDVARLPTHPTHPTVILKAKRRMVCTPTTMSQAPSKYGRISRSWMKACATQGKSQHWFDISSPVGTPVYKNWPHVLELIHVLQTLKLSNYSIYSCVLHLNVLECVCVCVCRWHCVRREISTWHIWPVQRERMESTGVCNNKR